MRPRQSSLGIEPVWAQNTLRSTPCFNEAEAIKPRNPPDHPKPAPLFQKASMRPRQSSLGILNMGGGVMVAPHASMRPRQSSLGINRTPCRIGSCAARASMRPRQSSLGILSTQTSVGAGIEASMRPRQSSLGIGLLAGHTYAQQPLQ